MRQPWLPSDGWTLERSMSPPDLYGIIRPTNLSQCLDPVTLRVYANSRNDRCSSTPSTIAN